MVKSMFAGVAGLRAHQTKMDVIGNNIANVNTNGFKAGRVTFKDSFYQTMSGSTSASGQMGGSNAKQVGYGSQVGAIDVIHTGGGFAPTGEASDLMISGNGFFCVGPYDKAGLDPLDKNSVPKLNLTRLGIFRFDGTGKLADPNGNVVYGFKGISAGTDSNVMALNREYITSDGKTVRMTAAGAPGAGGTPSTPGTPGTLPTMEFKDDDGTWKPVT
ncbi:MAG: flagellar hook-basal body complex protein, partial [Oscillospiraceae bacterium]